MLDKEMMKSDEMLIWWNREPIQFFQDKDSDTLNKIGASNSNIRMKRDLNAGNSQEAKSGRISTNGQSAGKLERYYSKPSETTISPTCFQVDGIVHSDMKISG